MMLLGFGAIGLSVRDASPTQADARHGLSGFSPQPKGSWLTDSGALGAKAYNGHVGCPLSLADIRRPLL